MSSKVSLCILAAFAVVNGVATTAIAATEPDESGIPDSIDYPDRASGAESASNEEIEASESANPDSIRYRDRFAIPAEVPAQGALVVLDR